MTTLYAVLLELKADGDAIISPTQGHHAYALFLTIMQQSNPKMAERLHGTASTKPFTISPLQGKFRSAGKEVGIIDASNYSVRITFLQEDVFAYFMDATFKAARQPLRLESAIFHIEEVAFNKQDSPLCHHQSYEDLFAEAQCAKKIRFRFLSPTAFRSGGKRNMLFPEAGLVFGSYLNRWQHFSPIKVDKLIARSWERIRVAQYALGTHILHFNSYREVGFEGDCTFELPADFDEDSLKTINALADFGFYCGTGAKTTMGMGQTRRVT